MGNERSDTGACYTLMGDRSMSLAGRLESSYRGRLPEPENNRPYQGNIWCVVASGVNLLELGSALRYACGEGNGTCDALEPGKECYEPVSLTAHASYAFSSYWAKFRNTGATCFFNGFAVQTTRDPSKIFFFLQRKQLQIFLVEIFD